MCIWNHKVESRGRKISNNMNLKVNPTIKGRVDGGSIKFIALKDGGSGDMLVARGTKGGRRRVGRGNQSLSDRGAIRYLKRGNIGGD